MVSDKIFTLVRVSRRNFRAEVKKPPPKIIKGWKLRGYFSFQNGIGSGKNIEANVLPDEEELEEAYNEENDDNF